MPTQNPSLANNNLRSHKVNEVLASKPNLSVLFGNSFIVIVLLCFLTFLNFYKIRTYKSLQFRSQNIASKNSDGSYTLTLLINEPFGIIKKSFNKRSKISLSVEGREEPVITTSILKKIDYANNVITVNVSPHITKKILSDQAFYTDDVKFEEKKRYMFGSVKISTDSASLFTLFMRKISARNKL